MRLRMGLHVRGKQGETRKTFRQQDIQRFSRSEQKANTTFPDRSYWAAGAGNKKARDVACVLLQTRTDTHA